MRAELKSLHSPDIDLASFWPEDAKDFSFLLQAMIGPEGQDAAESFDVLICTPNWITNNKRNDGFIWGRHLMIVFEYDLRSISSNIKSLCERTHGDDWGEIAEKLNRFLHWEFEDYQPFDSER